MSELRGAIPSKMLRREFGCLNLSGPNNVYRPPPELFHMQEEAKLHPARTDDMAEQGIRCRPIFLISYNF